LKDEKIQADGKEESPPLKETGKETPKEGRRLWQDFHNVTDHQRREENA